MQDLCFCGSSNAYSACCQPIIRKQKKAQTPEQLMRSRYSAYCTAEYDYILDTYAESEKSKLSLEEIAESASDTHWLALKVVTSQQSMVTGMVKFKAWYRVGSQYYLMHERSDFILENGCWRYHSGTISQDSGPIKVARNEACFCGSARKFKRCCGQH